jgi:N-acetylglutamate synthase-like GNAT family acetyltransferase
MSGALIRRIVESDVPALVQIVSENYSIDSAERFAAEVEMCFVPAPWRPWYYIAEMDGYVVGCAGHTPSWISWSLHTLDWVNVAQSYRSRGVGTDLVNRCLFDLEKRARAVIISTTAPEFYQKCFGFEEIARLAAETDEDVLMLKRFPARIVVS